LKRRNGSTNGLRGREGKRRGRGREGKRRGTNGGRG